MTKIPTTIFSVSDLTRRVKGLIETNFKNISVQGEISNFKLHSSGHLYFTLKDESSQIQGVMWRSRVGNLFFKPQEGMKIIATGNLTVYEVRGVYQIDVIEMQPLGVGELQMAFERLKQKLSSEGLFDPSHKKEIPRIPRRIGIITSPTGAAIRDMLNILQRRYPAIEVIFLPVKVQGAGAAEEVAGAIAECNAYGKIDVIIVGRGGGSIEDLWAFNEEIVARAIYASNIPVVSAVGHEIDFTISDFVADLRAPTPSAAAELTVPDIAELVEIVRNFHYTSAQLIREFITSRKRNIVSLLESYSFNKPVDLLRQHSQRIDELRRSMGRIIMHEFSVAADQAESLRKRLISLNPAAVLERGYAIVYRNDSVIQRAHELGGEDKVKITFHDGTKSAVIE